MRRKEQVVEFLKIKVTKKTWASDVFLYPREAKDEIQKTPWISAFRFLSRTRRRRFSSRSDFGVWVTNTGLKKRSAEEYEVSFPEKSGRN